MVNQKLSSALIFGPNLIVDLDVGDSNPRMDSCFFLAFCSIHAWLCFTMASNELFVGEVQFPPVQVQVREARLIDLFGQLLRF